MSTNELSTKVQELRELQRMQDELNGMIEAIKDSLKAEMAARQADELIGEDYKITWKAVKSIRVDSKALKADLPDVFSRYSKPTMNRECCIR